MNRNQEKAIFASVFGKRGKIVSFDVTAGKKAEMVNPSIVRLKSGSLAAVGNSKLTGTKMYRILPRKLPKV